MEEGRNLAQTPDLEGRGGRKVAGYKISLTC